MQLKANKAALFHLQAILRLALYVWSLNIQGRSKHSKVEDTRWLGAIHFPEEES